MSRIHLFTLAALVSATALAAQTPIPLEGTYTSGAIGAEHGCSPADLKLFYELGTVDFNAAGTFTATRASKEICPSGALPDQTLNDAGTYTLDSAGKLVLDFDPASPGTDVLELYLNPGRELAVRGPEPSTKNAGLFILCKQMDGATQADLAGAYGLTQVLEGLEPFSFNMESSYGTIDIDAAGVASVSLQWHEVDPTGTFDGFDSGPFGPILVAPDGTLSGGGENLGALCAGGDFGFIMSHEGTEFSIALFVRKASEVMLSDLGGAWQLHAYGGETDPFLNHETQSDQGPGSIDGTTGAFAFSGMSHHAERFGVSTSAFSTAGSIAGSSDGSFVATVTTGDSAKGWFSASLGVGITADVTAVDYAGAGILLRRCSSSFAFGTGSPGTGGVVSLLATSGLPKVGGNDFVFELSGGLGGGLAVLGVSAGAFPSGLPILGSTLYLNPSTIFLQANIALGGAAGAPGAGTGTLPAPIPISASPGVEFYAQAVLLDPGVPGFPMSNAVAFQLCE